MAKRLTEKQLASMPDEEFMEVYRLITLEAWSRMVRLSKGF